MGWLSDAVGFVTGGVKSVANVVLKNVGVGKGGWKGLLSSGLKQFAFSFIASAVLSFAYKKLAGKPKQPDFNSFTNEALARKSLIRSPVATRSLIYGTVRKSGAIVHAETLNDNKDLYLVIALCGHEVNSIGSVFFNDTEITSGQLDGSGNVNAGTFNGKAQIIKHLGATDQTVDTVLDNASSVWTSNHRLRGVAYLMVKLTYDVDVYPNGIPNISANVEGKKILNVTTSATAYSNNPANVIYNYLTSSDGLGASASEIDLASFQQARSDCDDSISVSGGTQNRYTCNGIIELNKKPVEAIEDLVSSCAGTLTYQQGKFKLKVGKASSSVRTLTDRDLAGELKIATRPKRSQLYNKVKGTFVDSTSNFSVKEFNTQESSAFQTSDGETIVNEIELPFTTDPVEAQRLALIVLKQSRQMMTLDLLLKPEHLDLGVGDVFSLTNTKLGFTAKKFFILAYTLNADLSVSVVAQEYADSVYDFDASTEQVTLSTASAINLPSPLSVTAPTSIAVTDSLNASGDGIVDVVMTATVSIPTEAFIGQYELEYKKSTESAYISAGRSGNNTFQVSGVEDGATYDVRAKVINTIGVSSSYVATTHLVVGATEPPSNCEDLAVSVSGKTLTLTWSKPPDLDLKETEIRHSTALSGATWIGSQTLTKVSRTSTSATLPAKKGTYLVKHIDKLDNFSINETSITTNITAITGLNFHTTFLETISGNTGVKQDVAVVQDSGEHFIVLSTKTNFDSGVSNFETNTSQFFDSGAVLNNTKELGFYNFTSVFDLSQTGQVKLEPKLISTSEDRDKIFDAVTVSNNNQNGHFDTEPSHFDGDASSFADIILQVATSNNNVDYSGFSDFNTTGEYSARYYKFRLKLKSNNNSANPKVSGMSVDVDVPDRIEQGADQVTSSGSKAITFSPPYLQQYAIGISSQNLQNGDRHTITNKTLSGFTVNYFNSSGSAIDRSFDFISKGF